MDSESLPIDFLLTSKVEKTAKTMMNVSTNSTAKIWLDERASWARDIPRAPWCPGMDTLKGKRETE